jgi:hypothetical protein
MHAFGWTKDKDVVRCSMSLESMIRDGIDPLHVDLFEDNAVSRSLPMGETLFFPPLRGFGFCVRIEGEDHIGVCVGKRQFTYSGKVFVTREGEVMKSLQPNKVPFARLVREAADPTTQPVLFYPQQLSVGATSLIVEGAPYACPTFTGAMFDPVLLEHETPEAINWLLSALTRWQPVVFGRCLSRVMTGQRVDNVSFYVDSQFIDAAASWLYEQRILPGLSTGGQVEDYWFDQNGCHYHFYCGKPDDTPAYSSDRSMLSCSRPNEVRATRIAAFDIRRKQRRLLYRDALTGVGRHRLLGLSKSELKRWAANCDFDSFLFDDGFRCLSWADSAEICST